MKLFTFILFFISSTNLLGTDKVSEIIFSIKPPGELGAPLELKKNSPEWGESIRETLASILERVDLSKTEKIRLLSQRYFQGYTTLSLAACFGFREIYEKMRYFLIDEGNFNEEDHMKDIYYVEEMLEGKKLPFYEGTIRLSFSKHPRGEEIVEKIWELSKKPRGRWKNSFPLLKKILYTIQNSSDEDPDFKRLAQSVKGVQGSYFKPLLKRVVENYLKETERPREFTLEEFLNIILGSESSFDDFFPEGESGRLCEQVKALLFNHERLNQEEANEILAQLDAED